MFVTLVAGVNPTPVSQALLCQVVASPLMGYPRGCLGQITSVEENLMVWRNFNQPTAEVITVTPERDPRAPKEYVHPASLTLMAESLNAAETTLDSRKIV